MKKNKRIISTMIVFILSLCLFSGCGSKEEVSDTAQFIKDKTLVVAIDNTYPPMEYVNKEGKTVGFDIELAKAIGKKMGREVEFINVGWDGIFAGLDSEKYDLVISSVGINKDRQEQLALSNPYLANQQVIISAKDGKQIKSVDELNGKTVAVQVSTTSDATCQYYLSQGIEFDLRQFDGMTEAFVALEGGSVDCVVTDLVVGEYYVHNNSQKFIKTCDKLTNEPIAIAAKKSNQPLIEEINKILDELKEEGTISNISKDVFGKDLTQNIDTTIKGYDEQ
ncbi:ABC transporter substrate-binding protein [Anaerofustis sp.]|uniref:ABC transporter substrate-binding protein n=1 Tax=Anaerofustis sp. TaxID=1872517 RepID=UPI0025C1C9E0|nr:ABC transporter substrate-binding protein [Anaerofustis sp.]